MATLSDDDPAVGSPLQRCLLALPADHLSRTCDPHIRSTLRRTVYNLGPFGQRRRRAHTVGGPGPSKFATIALMSVRGPSPVDGGSAPAYTGPPRIIRYVS
jgi:hypothetical protein